MNVWENIIKIVENIETRCTYLICIKNIKYAGGKTKEIVICLWKTPKMNVVTPLKGHVSMATDAQSSTMFFNLLWSLSSLKKCITEQFVTFKYSLTSTYWFFWLNYFFSYPWLYPPVPSECHLPRLKTITILTL